VDDGSDLDLDARGCGCQTGDLDERAGRACRTERLAVGTGDEILVREIRHIDDRTHDVAQLGAGLRQRSLDYRQNGLAWA
jgi:hypothetical protein